MSLQICCFRFSYFVLETVEFKKKGRQCRWQCSQYLELNPTCAAAIEERKNCSTHCVFLHWRFRDTYIEITVVSTLSEWKRRFLYPKRFIVTLQHYGSFTPRENVSDIFTVRKGCGKVMFSQVSVCPQGGRGGGGVYPPGHTPQADTSPGRHPPRRHPPEQTL